MQDEGLKHAYQDADKHNWTKEELSAYDYVFMREQDSRGLLTLALKRQNESVAKKMIIVKHTNEQIAKYTGLTIEQVEKLRSEG